jgi:hypothetical protein
LRDALFSEFAPNVDEGRGILVGERPEKNAIHDAEDGGIGAYPEGESEDRNNREARRLDEDAQAVAQILPEHLHKNTPKIE